MTYYPTVNKYICLCNEEVDEMKSFKRIYINGRNSVEECGEYLKGLIKKYE